MQQKRRIQTSSNTLKQLHWKTVDKVTVKEQHLNTSWSSTKYLSIYLLNYLKARFVKYEELGGGTTKQA